MTDVPFLTPKDDVARYVAGVFFELVGALDTVWNALALLVSISVWGERGSIDYSMYVSGD